MRNRSFISYLNKRYAHPLIGVEVGVKLGENASSMVNYLNLQKLYLVDPWLAYTNPSKEERRLGYINQAIMEQWYSTVKNKFIQNSKVEIIRKSSSEASNLFSLNSLDFVYIDANHNDVYSDCVFWYSKVKTGGVLCGHDWNNKEFYPKLQNDVKVFCNINHIEKFLADNCDWIIEK